MTVPEASRREVLRMARRDIAATVSELAATVALLRNGGWPETAEALERHRASLAVWTQPGGWFDHLEKPPVDMATVTGLPQAEAAP